MKPHFNAVDWLLLALAAPCWALILFITTTNHNLRDGGFALGLIIVGGITAAAHYVLKPHRHAFAIACLIAGACPIAALFVAAWIASRQ